MEAKEEVVFEVVVVFSRRYPANIMLVFCSWVEVHYSVRKHSLLRNLAYINFISKFDVVASEINLD